MINLYTTSTIGNYKTGTVTCTKNSPTVTGTGTTWKEIVNPGDILTLDDDKFYIISAVNSNTSLTLDKNFAENTATNVSYRILLNTAAHFPSDTAAKVERALEQLSDINEAAINNDRTVTAATKINGKGLTNTTGDINIYPNSVNANNGGRIQFHYNQGSTETAKIWENASGQVRIDGNLYLNGDVTSTIRADKVYYRVVDLGTGIRPTTSTIAQRWDSTIALINESDNKVLSSIYNPLKYTSATDWQNSIQLLVYDLTQENRNATLELGFNQNGVFTLAPTPAVTSNDRSIATTAFVNNRLPYTTGTWTPTLFGGTTNGEFTYEANNGGTYIKLGKIVFVFGGIVATCKSIPTGAMEIGGLPFNATGYGYRLWTTNNSSIEGFWLRYNSNYAIARVNTSNAGNAPLYFNSGNVAIPCEIGTNFSIPITGFYATNS